MGAAVKEKRRVERDRVEEWRKSLLYGENTLSHLALLLQPGSGTKVSSIDDVRVQESNSWLIELALIIMQVEAVWF